MQIILLEKQDIAWKRAALRECLEYGEHGIDTIIMDGKEVCFNCEGEIA